MRLVNNKFRLNKIYNEDCIRTMQRMIDSKVKCDLILTSPPYNTGRLSNSQKSRDGYFSRYDVHIDSMAQDEYIDWTVNLFNYFNSVLKENGVILYNMSYGSDTTVNTLHIGLMWLVIAEIIKQTDFVVVDRIIWKKSSALPNNTSSNKLTRIVEDVFVLCRKSEIKTFKTNKKVKSVRKNNPNQKYYENIFNFIEAKNNDGSCPYNKATYSTELCDKLLNIYAPNGSVVYDPFIGTGTTAVSCKRRGIDFIGSELSKNQCDWSEKRLKDTDMR